MSDLQKPQGIKEIAKLAEVSIGTVDRVIHDRPGVSAKTKERVKKIIEEVGYDPNPLARRLAGFKNVYKVAVIIPAKNEYNPYWNQHLSGIEQAKKLVGQFGIQVDTVFYDQRSEESFGKVTTQFFEDGYHAAVLTPLFQKRSEFFAEECNSRSIPVVCIDTQLDNESILSFIGQNSYESGFLAGKLASWKLQPEQIAIICHVTRFENLPNNFTRREQGFRDYLVKEHGHSADNIKTLFVKADNPDLAKDEIQHALISNQNTGALFIPNTRSFMVVPHLTSEQKKQVFTIGYDLVDENIQQLRENAIDVLISQKPEEQCYKGIEFVYKKIIAHTNPEGAFNIPIDIILKENIDYYLEENRRL